MFLISFCLSFLSEDGKSEAKIRMEMEAKRRKERAEEEWREYEEFRRGEREKEEEEIRQLRERRVSLNFYGEGMNA
ncbi:unnamed protein product [Trichobilharzia regenti]|nr:unnamed protein product [Trichobilharzia regenti]